MIDQQRLLKTLLSSLIVIVIGCTGKKNHESTMYINIYGKSKQRITVQLNKKTVYDKRDSMTRLIEVTRGPFVLNEKDVQIHYQIDNKDTTITFPLKNKNYVSIGYSDIRKEFQFTTADSLHFFNSRTD